MVPASRVLRGRCNERVPGGRTAEGEQGLPRRRQGRGRSHLTDPGGDIVALLGPSGGGKTTTLRLINRLEEATAGEVLVRGRDVRGQRPESLRRSIGYVVQEGGLFPT